MSRSRLVRTELDGPRDLARWRRIRRRIVAAQHRGDRTRPPVPASAIAVEVERGDGAQYPASVADVRAVLDRLPPGTLDGLGGVALRPSREEHDELAPGVLGPSTRGTYRASDATIELFGYLYDPATVRERGILEIYLRVQMLYTLLHEVGHHADYARRGRWREHEHDIEAKADALAARWLRAHALPYLEDTYPDELAELQRWLLRHAGVPLAIDVLLGARDGARYLFGASDGFEHLLAHVMRGERVGAQERCDFAYHLHIDFHLAEALEVVEGVLAVEPDHADALRWRRHVQWHLAQP
jgi:hypothetical protein